MTYTRTVAEEELELNAIELKRCPFCGGKAKRSESGDDYWATYHIWCEGSEDCGASESTSESYSKIEKDPESRYTAKLNCINYWNRRIAPLMYNKNVIKNNVKNTREETIVKLSNPSKGDRYHVLFSHWIHVIEIEEDKVTIASATSPCSFPDDAIYKTFSKEELVDYYAPIKNDEREPLIEYLDNINVDEIFIVSKLRS